MKGKAGRLAKRSCSRAPEPSGAPGTVRAGTQSTAVRYRQHEGKGQTQSNRVRDTVDSQPYAPDYFWAGVVTDALTRGMDGGPKTVSHANAEPARDGIVSGYGDGQSRLFVFALLDAASNDHGHRPKRRDLRRWPTGRTWHCDRRATRDQEQTVMARTDDNRAGTATIKSHLGSGGITDIVGGAIILFPFFGLLAPGSRDLDASSVVIEVPPATTPASAPAPAGKH